ncbi:hypothetical protein CMI47_10180 [Candidatus Pacearchaeota archaeon]|nr:hypothetical protein [Candidatus Pacearchaeota archaeon]|tara:strand:- start:8092 stop:8271 length:180 start_codon:yes stop_codon:yes gene_type:complete
MNVIIYLVGLVIVSMSYGHLGTQVEGWLVLGYGLIALALLCELEIVVQRIFRWAEKRGG